MTREQFVDHYGEAFQWDRAVFDERVSGNNASFSRGNSSEQSCFEGVPHNDGAASCVENMLST